MSDTIRKQFPADVLVADGKRTVTARISTISVDRDGEVLIPQGCDANEFTKSPTVFYNHNYALPVGRCEGIRRSCDNIEAKTRFAERPAEHKGEWLPDTVFSLLQQGVISGFSVGFTPIEGRHPSKKDRESFGSRVRYVYNKWKLLEYSVAPLPANQDALVLAVSKGIVSLHAAQTLFPDMALPEKKVRRTVFVVTPPPPQPRLDVAESVRRRVLRSVGALYA